MRNLSLKWFLHHFVNDQREDKKFCFILGAGASRSSGIRTGGELANLWVNELYGMEDKETIDKWLEEEKIPLDDLAQGYSKIYDKRFIDPRDGFDFLEKEMERKEPSCGYSVLANILSTTQHKMVITTNFDSLCEDALFIYSQKKPLIVGHEALANFIRPFSGRPAVVKIHRDLFLSPMNKNNDTCNLAENFKKSLRDVFKYYTPLVVGYGGNDGSLMNYLLELDSADGGMFWFHVGDTLSEKIKTVIKKFNGYAVKINGFDDFMIQLGDKLGYAPMDTKIIEYANSRANKYREQFDTIRKKIDIPEETKTAISRIDKRTVNKNWWYYQKLIDKQEEVEIKDKLYKEYIAVNPDYYQLIGNYANFLTDIRKEYIEAERCYQRAIELAPNDAINIGNYALFLNNIRKEYDEAEKYYKRALELDANDAHIIGNYALFLKNIHKEYDEAEKYYKRAIELDANDADYVCNYANFLYNIRKEYDEAEKYYKRAIELDPNDAVFIGNYANFLSTIRKEYDEAEKNFKRALELDPNLVNNIGNYANFLSTIRKEYDEAEKNYKRALELDPNDADLIGNYANFLNDFRKEHDEAEKNYKRAIELDPSNANNTGNYAKLKIELRQYSDALALINKAFTNNQKEEKKSFSLEFHFYCYAIFWKEYPSAKENVLRLLEEGIRSPGWSLDEVVNVSEELKHPEIVEVKRLAKLISAEK